MIRFSATLIILLLNFSHLNAQKTAEINVAMAEASMLLDKHEDALRYCNSALDLEPNNLEAKLIRGGLYSTWMNDPDKGILDLSACKSANFKMDEVHFFLGKAYTRKEMYSVAFEHANSAVIGYDASDGYNLVEAYFARGVCNQKLERYNEAVADFTKVNESWSWHVEALWFRGECYTHLFQERNAIDDLTKALSMETNELKKGMIVTARGDAHRGLSEEDAACEDYQRGKALGYIIANFRLAGCTGEPDIKEESAPTEATPLFDGTTLIGGTFNPNPEGGEVPKEEPKVLTEDEKLSCFIGKNVCGTITKGLNGLNTNFVELRGERYNEEATWGEFYKANFVDNDCKELELHQKDDFDATFTITYMEIGLGLDDPKESAYNLTKSYEDLLELFVGCVKMAGYEVTEFEDSSDSHTRKRKYWIKDPRYSEKHEVNDKVMYCIITIEMETYFSELKVNFFVPI